MLRRVSFGPQLVQTNLGNIHCASILWQCLAGCRGVRPESIVGPLALALVTSPVLFSPVQLVGIRMESFEDLGCFTLLLVNIHLSFGMESRRGVFSQRASTWIIEYGVVRVPRRDRIVDSLLLNLSLFEIFFTLLTLLFDFPSNVWFERAPI